MEGFLFGFCCCACDCENSEPSLPRSAVFSCRGFSFLFCREQWGAVVAPNVQMPSYKQRYKEKHQHVNNKLRCVRSVSGSYSSYQDISGCREIRPNKVEQQCLWLVFKQCSEDRVRATGHQSVRISYSGQFTASLRSRELRKKG